MYQKHEDSKEEKVIFLMKIQAIKVGGYSARTLLQFSFICSGTGTTICFSKACCRNNCGVFVSKGKRLQASLSGNEHNVNIY